MRAAPPTFAATLRTRLLTPVLACTIASVPLTASPAVAQTDDPTLIVTFYDEAGKAAQLVKDEAGADQWGEWAHRRWTRDRDNEDKYVGPVELDSKVWVVQNAQKAQQLYKQQSDLHPKMPERADEISTLFAWEIREGPKPQDFADEGSGASGCRHANCDEPGKVFTHRRVVIRVGRYVGTVYMYGRDETATPELATWFAKKLSERMRPPEPEPEEEP